MTKKKIINEMCGPDVSQCRCNPGSGCKVEAGSCCGGSEEKTSCSGER